MEIDYEDIEDSQVIASAKVINAQIITRDGEMLKKYKKIAITPKVFLEQFDIHSNRTSPRKNKKQ